MTPVDTRVLLGLLDVVGLFVVYEMLGLDPTTPLHTISFIALHHVWLRHIIGGIFLLGGVGGWLWWRHHMTTDIYKIGGQK